MDRRSLRRFRGISQVLTLKSGLTLIQLVNLSFYLGDFTFGVRLAGTGSQELMVHSQLGIDVRDLYSRVDEFHKASKLEEEMGFEPTDPFGPTP